MPSLEEQCEMVRAWCERNGVCPPAAGWEWVWYGRVVISEEDAEKERQHLPRFETTRGGLQYP